MFGLLCYVHTCDKFRRRRRRRKGLGREKLILHSKYIYKISMKKRKERERLGKKLKSWQLRIMGRNAGRI
jgi:hypothetical protein